MGINTIYWSGIDNLGNPIVAPDTFRVDIKIANGLTNYPMQDVEGNPNGLLANHIRPGVPKILPNFWDNSLIGVGNPIVNVDTGCAVNPCNSWLRSQGPGDGPGNNRTINTWWFNVLHEEGVFVVVDDNNCPPLLRDDTGSTAINTPLTTTIQPWTSGSPNLNSGVLDNDDPDPDGNPLGVPTVVTQPSNGTVVLNPNGTYTYTPNTNFVGTDVFVYEVCDIPPAGTAQQCATAVVTISVLGPQIGVALTSGSPNQVLGCTYDVPFTITVENLDTFPADNVQIEHDLNAGLPSGATVVSVVTPPSSTSGLFTFNTLWDGVSNTKILVSNSGTNPIGVNGDNTLPSALGTTYQIDYTVRIDLNASGFNSNYYNNVIATTSSTQGGTASSMDVSDDGTVADQNSNGDPGDQNENTPNIINVTRPDETLTVTNDSICLNAGASIDVLLSEVGVTYQLRDPSGVNVGIAQVGTGGTLTFNIPAPAQFGNYSVLAVGTNCSVQLNDFATIVPLTPSVSIADQYYCDGQAPVITIPATPGALYTFYDMNLSVLQGPSSTNTFNTGVIAGTTDTFIVSKSIAGCESNLDTVPMTVFQTNLTPLIPDLVYCPGDSQIITIPIVPEATLYKFYQDDSTTLILSSPGINYHNIFPPVAVGDSQDFVIQIQVGWCDNNFHKVTVSVIDSSNAGNDGSLSICSNTNSLDLSTVVTGGDPGGTWHDFNSNILGGPVVNPVTLGMTAAGSPYVFFYAVGPSGTCAADTAYATIAVADSANAGGDAAVNACSTDTILNLFNQLTGTPASGGTWVNVNSASGLSGNILNPSLAGVGTFQFIYVVNSGGACPADSATVIVTINQGADAGADNSITWCNSSSINDMFAALGGTPQSGGTWVNVNSQGVITGNNLDLTGVPFGTYNYEYIITTTSCGNDTSTLTVTVSCDPPVIISGNGNPNNNDTITGISTFEDIPIVICLDATDNDGVDLDVDVINSTAQNGGITGTGNPNDTCFNYTPNPNWNGIDTLLVIACDNSGLCDTVTIIVVVNPVNDPPVAINDTAYTILNTAVIIDILNNDSDPLDPLGNIDPGTTTIVPGNGPSNGNATVNLTTGEITYTPNNGFIGIDSLQYNICDDGNPLPPQCAFAWVYIVVDSLNIPPVIVDSSGNPIDTLVFTIPEDSFINVCINVIDSNGQNVDVTGTFGGPNNGGITGVGDGDTCFTYTPNTNWNGSDTVIAVVCDNGVPALCDTVVVIINVTPVNDPPIAIDDQATTTVGTTVVVDVQSNDSDVDGDPLTTTSVISGPSNGSITIINGDSISYTPTGGFTGTDTFIYVVCDPGPLCDTAIVVVTVGSQVNTPPVIVDSTGNPIDTLVFTIPEDSFIVVCPQINDPDGDTVDVTGSFGGPTNGGITGIGDGDTCFTYTPNTNWNGTDTVSIIVCDNGSPVLCDTVVVIINVTPVNDPPIAVDDATSTPVGTTVVIDVQSNDSDPDGDPLTTTNIISGPNNGSATVVNGDSISYTPTGGFTGIDTIVYVVCDPFGLCDTAVVLINVGGINNPPVITDPGGNPIDTLITTTPEDTPITICLNGVDIDLDSIDVVGSFGGPSNGGITGLGDGDTCFIYSPDTNFVGLDTVSIIVCDNGIPSLCDTVVVIIDVTPVNDAPVASSDTIYVTVIEDSSEVICISTTDVDLDLVDINSSLFGPSHGIMTGLGDGDTCITYTPIPGYIGGDTIVVTICDNGTPILCDTVVIIIDVIPVNDPPIANDDITTVDPGGTVTFPVLINDNDPDGDPLTVNLCSGANFGTVIVVNDSIQYIANFPQPDTIDTVCYYICDPSGLCDTANLIVIIPQNELPPVATDDNVQVNEDDSICFTVLGNDIDPNLDSILLGGIFGGPSNGSASTVGDTICYVPDSNFTGTDTIYYIVCDTTAPSLGGPLCDTGLIVIDVLPVNDPPVVIDTNTGNPIDTLIFTIPEDSFITICVNVIDPDSDLVDITNINPGPSNGGVTGLGNGDTCITYTPNPNWNGIDTFNIIVCDNGAPTLCDTVVIIVNVTPVNDPPVANTDTVSTLEETPIVIDVQNNDFDVDGDSLTTTILVGPSNGPGTVINGDSIIYVPDTNFTGIDTIIYVICDNGVPVLCDTDTVFINVIPVNDPPVIVDSLGNPIDTIYSSTPHWTADTICVYVIDVDGDTVDVTSVINGPLNGTISGLGNGDTCFIYTPDSGFIGIDTMTAIVCDGGNPNLCDTVIVIIDVYSTNLPPEAVDDTVNTTDSTLTIIDVQANDFDPNNNDNLTTTIIGGPNHGTAIVLNGDSIAYTADFGYCGPDTITYEVCDNGVPIHCDTAIVIINVTLLDSDGDGIADFYEGLTADTDGDGILNYLDLDSDNDGIPDSYEALGDLSDICNPIIIDFDGDSIPDYLDLDSDNDGLYDVIEADIGILDLDNDGMVDNFTDVNGDGIDDNNFVNFPIDTDGDSFEDFRDIDSDDDDTPDGEEFDVDEDGVIDDCDEDGIPDWRDPDNCEIVIPEAFSPNGDGVNETFRIRLLSRYPDNSIVIYNRWGNKVFEAQPYNSNNWWDGRNQSGFSNGNETVPDGTYFYILDLGDGSDKKTGYVYMKR
ncbi:MAG: Ig-like domain-containing protein [Flavobacteriales bacterium]|nr:Ig-like domain-containing protein [Flavobacteriales bacterium]